MVEGDENGFRPGHDQRVAIFSPILYNEAQVGQGRVSWTSHRGSLAYFRYGSRLIIARWGRLLRLFPDNFHVCFFRNGWDHTRQPPFCTEQ